MDRKFLEEMLDTVSVSGYETELQKKVIEHMKPICDEIQTDATGNVISVLNPESDVKILLCGHIDEIGFIVTHIQEDGFLRVTQAGGVRCALYVGTHVQIKTKNKIVKGVVVTNSSLLKKDKVEAEDLIIDIGASSKSEAMEEVSVGDCVCAATSYEYLMKDRMTARAMDDRIGAFIVLEALKRAKEKECVNGVYSATTVGEETTMRGAYWASQKVKPTVAIAVDVTYTSDYDGVNPLATGEVSIGKGAVLCRSSIVNNKVNEILEACAKKLNLPLQYEIAAGRTGTDADHVHFTNDGVPVALVSIPLRYMHSSVETLSLKDVEDIIELLSEFLCTIQLDTDLDPLH